MSILANLDVPATTNTFVYRVASNRIVRRILLANRTSASISVRLWLVPANTDLADSHAVFYDEPLRNGRSISMNEDEIKLGNQEEVWVRASATGVSISVMD